MALSYPTVQKEKTYVPPATPAGGSGNTLASMASTTNPYEYNPGSNAEQYGANIQPQSYVGGQVQNRNSLSSLNENLANSYQNTLSSMLSGDAYSPYKTAQFQGMNKSAQQLRANAQQANVGRAGQGTAIANKNATEASIAQMAGETALNAAMAEQEMKERGLTAANTLSKMNEDVRASDIKQGMATDTAYGYLDPITGNRVKGSNELAEKQVAIEQQTADTNRDLGYAQLGLDAQKLAETARQFNVSTQEAAYQFTQKLNFDYASLSQQDKQYLTSLGFDREKFEESKRQYDLTTSLEDKYRTKDLDIKEQTLAQEASQFSSRLAFDQWATQAGLDDAAANRIWQATQNDKQLQNAKDVQQMVINQDQWKQNKIDELTRAGWSVEDARANADRQQQLTLANIQNTLTREIESGRITQAQAELAQQASQFASQQVWNTWAENNRISESDKARAWTTKERIEAQAFESGQATFQAQLQKELAAGSWIDSTTGQKITSTEAQRLLEEVRQFDKKEDFDRWAVQQNMSEADKNRLWETNERIANNIFQANLQTLNNELALKGIKYQTTMSYLESLDPGDAADILQAIAIDAGITYVVKDKDGGVVIDPKTGEPKTEVGFPPTNSTGTQKGYDLAVQLEGGEISSLQFRNGDKKDSPTYNDYQALLNVAPNYTLRYKYSDKAERVNIINAPSKGSVIKMDGVLYLVTSDVTGMKRQSDKFTVENLSTGNSKTIQPKW